LQNWSKGIKRGKFRALVRMTGFDNWREKYWDYNLKDSNTWDKRSMYVLCDTSSIAKVVEQLSVE